MKILLIFIAIINSSTLFSQFYTDSKIFITKEETIIDLNQDNCYFKFNSDLSYKGTKERLEYSNCDTLYNECKLRRLTKFNPSGEVIFDSLIINNTNKNQIFTWYLHKIDSISIFNNFKNGNLSKSDTFVFNNKNYLIEHRTTSSKTSFKYNNKGLLTTQIKKTPTHNIEKQIMYFQDSIIVLETEIGRLNHDIRKWYYYFNSNSQILKDSFFTIKQRYKQPNFKTFNQFDTSYYIQNYKYDKNNNLIKAIIGSTKLVMTYKNKRKEEVMIFNLNDEPIEAIKYYYIDNNIVKKHFKNNELKPSKTERINFLDGLGGIYTTTNASQLKNKEIVWDSKRRIIKQYDISYCSKYEYIDY